MMIATDIAEMERVLGGLLDEHAVSEQFKVLRAFRAVLFLSVEDLCTVRNVPRTMLLNHLFSRAGDALLSPYKVSLLNSFLFLNQRFHFCLLFLILGNSGNSGSFRRFLSFVIKISSCCQKELTI